MVDSEIEILNTAQGICARPLLFTASGSLCEVLAVFVGFNHAVLNGTSPRETSPVRVLKWLSDEFSDSKRRSLQEVVIALIDRYSTESAALEAISQYAGTLNDD